MVLPDEISSAAYDGDVDTVRRFLAQHPERVNDVEEPEGHLAMLTVAIRLVVDPETRGRALEFVRLLISCGANQGPAIRRRSHTSVCAACRRVFGVFLGPLPS